MSSVRDAQQLDKLVDAAKAIALHHASITPRLAALTDLLWGAYAPLGCSWIGFYVPSVEGGEDALILSCCKPKPACSPIGMHGVCGQSFREGVIRIVEDVALLGAAYVACDPRDRSEIVVPIFVDGLPAGVLDLDSQAPACFTDADASALTRILASAGLLDRRVNSRSDKLPTR